MTAISVSVMLDVAVAVPARDGHLLMHVGASVLKAIPLQQLLGGHVGQQLHVVNQCHPVNVAAATGASLASSAANANIVLQPVMPGIPPNNNNQTCFLSHQLPVEVSAIFVDMFGKFAFD